MLDLETFATAVRNVPLWFVNIFALGLLLRYALSILGLTRVYSEENTIKERVCFSGMFLITMILGTLNTCDMIYEYTETKEQQKNNNKEKSIKDKNS